MASPLHLPHLEQLPTESVERKIVDSIEDLGFDEIDTMRAVIVGSAALRLYGVQLYRPEAQEPGRPGDIDLTIDASLFMKLNQARETPSGVPLRAKEQCNPRFTIMRAEGEFPIDLITQFTFDRGSIEKYDKNFQKHYNRNSQIIPGSSDVRIATPDYLKQTLKQQKNDLKYADDLRDFTTAEQRAKNKR